MGIKLGVEVKDKVTGYKGIVSAKDFRAIAAGALRLIKGRDFAHELGTNARDFVRKEYDADHAVDKIVSCYQETVE